MTPDYTLLDHAADFGLEVRASDEPSLLANAVLAVSDAMFGLGTLSPAIPVTVAIEADETEMRLFQVLSEAIFRIDAEGLLPAEVSVETLPDGPWRLRMRCDRFDPARHRHRIVFKAVTLHGIEVRRTAEGLTGRVVLDA